MADWLLALILLYRPDPAPADAARYASIASDMAAVVEESGGSDSLALTTLAIAIHESGLRAEVDDGRERGSGTDVCLMQIRTHKKRADQLAADRRECLRVGVRLARSSLAACRAQPWTDRLAAYASGRCDAGQTASREIMGIRARLADRLSFLRRTQDGS
jgi:hypothetical protein